jgi:hypothetical protein
MIDEKGSWEISFASMCHWRHLKHNDDDGSQFSGICCWSGRSFGNGQSNDKFLERYFSLDTGMLFFVVLFAEIFGGVHRMFYLRACEEDLKLENLKKSRQIPPISIQQKVM